MCPCICFPTATVIGGTWKRSGPICLIAEPISSGQLGNSPCILIGGRVEEDLRHEMTHGLLHASLKTVPLWLDEGLAEYFEVAGPDGIAHPEHAATIRNLLETGWSPSLERLESIQDFDRLTQQDYAESWAWVYYMLHADVASRDTLLSYVATLRNEEVPGRLRDSLPRDASLRMADHVRRLPAIPSAGVVQIQGG